MKRNILSIAIVGLFIVTGCDIETGAPTADQRQAQATRKSMAEADRQLGMPAIVNFQEKRLFKSILELRDQENLVCYAYLTSLDGKVGQFLGKCIGYGLPYSVQYTNPQVLKSYESSTYGSWAVTVPQPDPNGLFMPEGLSATWLILIGPDGQPRPVYVEPQIIVSPFPLHKA